MDESAIIGSVIGALVGVAVPLLFGARSEKQRSGFLQKIAPKLGMKYHAKDEKGQLPYVLRKFELLSNSTGLRVSNLLVGQEHGAQVLIFDLRVSTHDKAHPTQTKGALRTALLIEYPHTNLPFFVMEPRHRKGPKLRESQDMDTVAFLDDPEFSKKYLVRGMHAQATQSVLSPPVRRFFAQKPGMLIEARHQYILLLEYGGKQRLPNLEKAYHGLLQLGVATIDRLC